MVAIVSRDIRVFFDFYQFSEPNSHGIKVVHTSVAIFVQHKCCDILLYKGHPFGSGKRKIMCQI